MWSLWAGLQRCEYTASAPVSLPHQLSLVIMTSVVLGHTRKAKQWRAAIVYWNYLLSFSYSLSQSLSQTHTHIPPPHSDVSLVQSCDPCRGGVRQPRRTDHCDPWEEPHALWVQLCQRHSVQDVCFYPHHIGLGERDAYSWWHTVLIFAVFRKVTFQIICFM